MMIAAQTYRLCRWYYLPDLGIALDCVYDDETGELKYCDIYA